MQKVNKKLFLIYYLFFVIISYSQSKFDNFQFRSIKDGISKRGVWSIVQDKKGYIWLGTNEAGLYRYDGTDYVVYETDWKNPKSINSNLIYVNYVDSHNKLWVGTEEGLCWYDRDLNRFESIDLKSVLKINKSDLLTVRSLIEDNEGNLLVGTEQYGLLKVNLKTFKVTVIKSNIPLNKDLFIRSIAKNNQGKIFVATNVGLKYFDSKKDKVEQLVFVGSNNSKSEITISLETIFFENNGNLWVGTTENGLIKVVKKAIDYQKFYFPITNKRIFSIVAVDNNNIFCATENDGLFLVNNSGAVAKKYSPNKFDKNGLKSNSIWSLMKDRENRIWIGYYNKGVCVFDKLSGQFNSIESLSNNVNSLQTSSVSSIASDSSGKLWISMEGGGIDVFNPKTKK